MSALGDEIRLLVASEGPIGLDRYMALALSHPAHGYYRTRDPLGRAGDFTTAPEISQMFGELLGLWAASVWTAMGRPHPVVLAELGPGRGTLMSDALRAARAVPGFADALSVHLVETSPPLREKQRATLAGVRIAFHDRIDTLPPGPAILLANEFLDALPIRQFVRAAEGWHERLVGLGREGGLAFGLAPAPEPALAGTPGRAGEVREVAPAALAVVREVAARLARDGGAALFVDYGHDGARAGDTFQAVRRHGFDDPLRAPGEADLTAHVDFGALARAGRAAGASAHGLVDQGRFLEALGIRERAARLRRGKDAGTSQAVDAALARLIAPEPGGMGRLFKVLGLSGPGLPTLPGLPAPATGEPDRSEAAERPRPC